MVYELLKYPTAGESFFTLYRGSIRHCRGDVLVSSWSLGGGGAGPEVGDSLQRSGGGSVSLPRGSLCANSFT